MAARSRCFVFGVLVSLGLAVAGSPAAEPEPAPARPKLVVLLIFDQLRGDYLCRWDDLFVEGGFRRLTHEGACFQNCHYPYAITKTAPGHATLCTGATPARHGMIANEWFDRAAGEMVYCTGGLRYTRVPPAPKTTEQPEKPDDKTEKTEQSKKPRGEGTPERLLSPTFADALKDATDGKAHVVSLSFKDRGAVLTAGTKPDACYWWDVATGNFATSTYYRDSLHPWVREYNATRPGDRWFGKEWTRLRSDLDYAKYSGPDEAPGEGKGKAQGVAFPHPLSGGLKKIGKAYHEAVYNSPFGNEVLLELVKRAIVAEKLGTHNATDFMSVSFSCNDPVGHCWGPDSQEVLDTTLRSDLVVKELLEHLDQHVGKGKYLICLSADHGICPLPEVARKQGKDGQRDDPKPLREKAEEYLQGVFNVKSGKAIENWSNDNVYLSRRWLRAQGIESWQAEDALARWLARQRGVQAVYTRTQLLKGVPRDDTLGRAVAESFHPARSGDLVIVLKPYHLFTALTATGTGHGTPHEYDTHVPLVIFGTGVQPGARSERISPQAAVTILAHAAGIEPPGHASAPLPAGVFAEGKKGER
jgi:hypothetical protein